MVMHHFLTLNPGLVSHLEDDFRRTLSDPDPGVMEASLILFHELVKVCMCVTVYMCGLVCTCAWLHKVWYLCEGETNYSRLDTLALLPSHVIKNSIKTSQYMCIGRGYPYNQAI